MSSPPCTCRGGRRMMAFRFSFVCRPIFVEARRNVPRRTAAEAISSRTNLRAQSLRGHTDWSFYLLMKTRSQAPTGPPYGRTAEPRGRARF